MNEYIEENSKNKKTIPKIIIHKKNGNQIVVNRLNNSATRLPNIKVEPAPEDMDLNSDIYFIKRSILELNKVVDALMYKIKILDEKLDEIIESSERSSRKVTGLIESSSKKFSRLIESSEKNRSLSEDKMYDKLHDIQSTVEFYN